MRYKSYVNARLEELEYRDVPSLNEKEWQPISISSIFTLVRGREGNMAKMEAGTVPLISAKSAGNGLKGFVGNPKNIVQGNCITLNNDGDGGAGLAYYQPASMALDTHVTALQPKVPMSKWSMLFISRCLSGLHGFFGHGLSISNPRAARIKVMLPVTSAGKPDYEYMEQYTKNMMLRKYEQYFEYLDK
ncbi:restriction endonuclease subunit S [Paratractidigestivibacter sp.]|uniref:restriction endonuclease subunit S n=1 Tax=Paratractidigestivibacter sp. TaxID=2847316 RepID=UPI002ACB0A33|nr:restriction endonuclease subunit S [Paratractidigestivibacter sp.]